MIVVDTSVFMATILAEPEEAHLTRVLMAAQNRAMSAANYLECAVVAVGRGAGGRDDLDAWLASQKIEIVPVDRSLAAVAADAFTRFREGRHRARLNYGDCFAYALARTLGAPLLFKGADFAATDVTPAI